MQTATLLSVTVGVLTGLVGFVMGVLMQQDASYRGIHTAMENDPYIYRKRKNIFKALSILGPRRSSTNEMPRSSDASEKVSAQDDNEDSLIRASMRWFQNNIKALTTFFTYSLGDEPLQTKEPTLHVASLMKYGFPGLDDLHIYENFVISYDRRNRIAHWVCEHLVKECLCNVDTAIEEMQEIPEFFTDLTIPQMFRSSLKDYRHTDWITGQMAAPNNHKCSEINYTETFILSNIIPLCVQMRTNVWIRLENYVRELTLKCGSVYVYTGPIFMPQRITFRHWAIRHQVIGANTVAVPTHFFKVIIAECRDHENCPYVEGYVVPNTDIEKNIELSAFLTDIHDIEHFAGLKFFDGTSWANINQGHVQ